MWMRSCNQQDDSSFQLSTTSSQSPTLQSHFLVQAATPQSQPVTIHVAPVKTQSQSATSPSQPVTIHVAPIKTETQPATSQSEPVTIHVAPLNTQSPSSSSTNSTNKRRYDAAEENTIASMQQYSPSKCARVDSCHCACGTEERYMVWAKNLIEQLKLVHNENKRIALQIQINRLVQNEIMCQIDQQ